MRKVALISEHAAPEAPLGGVNNGGQNVYVAHIARNLAASGYEVDIFTRKDHSSLPEVKEWLPGIRIIYVPAGPAEYVPKEELFQYMDPFAKFTMGFFKSKNSLTISFMQISGCRVGWRYKSSKNCTFPLSSHSML
jgi:D-inositol-3-phosphate glycosyltransferase